MNVQQNVKMILARFNARKFNGLAARQELSSLLDYTEAEEKTKLQNLIRVFRRPGFDTPQFKAALVDFMNHQRQEETT